SFSSSSRANDLSKLTLIGYLAKEPEARLTKNDKEYITHPSIMQETTQISSTSYVVAVRNPPPPPGPDGERRQSTSTFHRILSFQEGSNKYLRTLKKGSKVYCESTFELKEPAADADPSTPQGQRQIFLRHESIRVISYPKVDPEQATSHEDTTFN
ncbi:hypothetical protein CVT25_008712, partial [Psilocybe cyanescens]